MSTLRAYPKVKKVWGKKKHDIYLFLRCSCIWWGAAKAAAATCRNCLTGGWGLRTQERTKVAKTCKDIQWYAKTTFTYNLRLVQSSASAGVNSLLYLSLIRLRQMKKRRKALQKHGGAEQAPTIPLIWDITIDSTCLKWPLRTGRPRTHWKSVVHWQTKKSWRDSQRSRRPVVGVTVCEGRLSVGVPQAPFLPSVFLLPKVAVFLGRSWALTAWPELLL